MCRTIEISIAPHLGVEPPEALPEELLPELSGLGSPARSDRSGALPPDPQDIL